MFLTRLDTVGFKSFAERIKMEFVPGVTAVVGPNGSGKSNIIDAIRWVLGEQSAKSLRGQKMEDIIFQGSDTRKALNFAEVTLVLNNSKGQLPLDYQEIHVTRRVFRSGESEFLINKQTCRLKDIIDLFMDTGLGRESFSIIGQGKIDEILSSKAEERRAVFEEAAGVLKYKQRKNRAEFKLQETTDNLDRVEDIIHEIEQQIEPLKKQADIAQTYKTKRAALQQVEVAVLITEIDQLHKKWQDLSQQLEKDQMVAMNSQTQIQEKDAKITRDRETLHQLNEAISNLQNELLSITEQLEQTEGKRNVLKERSTHIEKNKQHLLVEQQQYKEQIHIVKQKQQQAEEELRTIASAIRICVEKINDLQERLDYGLDAIQAKIEDKKSDYIEYLNERAVIENEKLGIDKELQKMKHQGKFGTSTFEKTIEQEKVLKSKKQAIEKELQQENQCITDQNMLLAQKKDDIKKARAKYDAMQQNLYEGNEKIATLASKKDMLEEMKESFQGYFYGVKEVLRAKKQGKLPHIDGVVLDVMDVPDRYMTAIDTVLGTQAQYIVVETDQIARNTINWLKRENKGRATFLPLQSISARIIPEGLVQQISKLPGFLGVASNLIGSTSKYEKVVKHLMGNVIITETLKNANEIAKKTERKFRVVTLDGDMVYPGGSMSGGAKKNNNASLFSREKEIKIITDKLVSFRSRAKNYEEKVHQQKLLIQKNEQGIQKLELDIEDAKQKIQLKQKHLNEVMVDYRTIADKLSVYELQSKEHAAEETKLKKRKKEKNSQLTIMNQKILDVEIMIEQLTEKEQMHKTDEKQIEKLLHEQEIKKASLGERKRAQLEQTDYLKGQLSELQQAKVKNREQLEGSMNEAEIQQLAKSLDRKISGLKLGQGQKRQLIEEKRQKHQELTQKTEDAEKELKGLSYKCSELTKHIQEIEVQVNRFDVSLDNRLATLQEDYRMTYEKAVSLYQKIDNLPKTKEQVAILKQEIKQLGTVNLGAIEEYDRLNERYQFLLEQQADLVQAKTTLYSVIQEMDQEMTRRFSTVFTEIQAAFSVVFRQLFGGGEAQLVLTEPNQLLETGIEITAKPPGKKLKTLGLLSGGERALTAIALLFAILRVRPVPFCILDEVDAALDEANVERFGSYLQAFSTDTQFIIITHRRGTMEEANALYGITMQESGVSRLVSVKLEDTRQLVETT